MNNNIFLEKKQSAKGFPFVNTEFFQGGSKYFYKTKTLEMLLSLFNFDFFTYFFKYLFWNQKAFLIFLILHKL